MKMNFDNLVVHIYHRQSIFYIDVAASKPLHLFMESLILAQD
jgi:hypothetical protein